MFKIVCHGVGRKTLQTSDFMDDGTLFVSLTETPAYSPLVGLKASRINLVGMGLFSLLLYYMTIVV